MSKIESEEKPSDLDTEDSLINIKITVHSLLSKYK